MFAIAMPLAAWAGDVAPPPCVPGTLADYLALEGGCTIEDKVFSDFSYNNIVQPSEDGPLVVDPSSIFVTPDSTALNPGLTFQGGWSTVGGQSSDIQIGFTVTVLPGGNAIKDASLAIVSGVVGEAAVLGTEVLWLGCTGPCPESAQLQVWDFDGTANDHLFDSTTFDPVLVVAVEKDILLVSTGEGRIDFAAVTIIHQNFSEVPEPATLTLFGTGLLVIGGKLRSMKNRKKSA